MQTTMASIIPTQILHLDPSVPRPGKHELLDLIEQATQKLKEPQWLGSTSKIKAIQAFRTWYNKELRPNNTYRISTQKTRLLVMLLDHILFQGRVRKYCVVTWDTTPFPHTMNAFTNHLQPSPSARWFLYVAHIHLDPHLAVRRGRFFDIDDLICYLLHEMCHAYILIFSCKDRQCQGVECAMSSRGHQNAIGATGHGPAWTALAQSVEAASVVLRTSKPVDLRIATHEESMPTKRGLRSLVERRNLAWLSILGSRKSRMKRRTLATYQPQEYVGNR